SARSWRRRRPRCSEAGRASSSAHAIACTSDSHRAEAEMTGQLSRMTGRIASVVALWIALVASAAGQTTARRAVNGEWTGTLQLDNSRPQLSLVFEITDSTLAGKVYSDGGLVGPMEDLSVRGDTVHFKVDRLDFTGRVSGAT